MAGGGEATSTISINQSILKEVYGLVNMITRQRRKSYDMFTQSSKKMTGKYWMTAEHLEGGQGSVGSRPDGIELPPAQNETYVNGKTFDRFHYAGFRFTGPALAHATGDVGSFVDLTTSEIENKTRWLIDYLNMSMYMDGYGVLGTVSVGGAAGSMTLNTTSAPPTNPLFLRKGLRFDTWSSNWRTSATPTKRTAAGAIASATRQGFTITAYNKTTGVLTYSAGQADANPVASVAGDLIVFEDIMGGAGTVTATGVATPARTVEGAGLSGLAIMVDDGTLQATFQSIDRTANAEYKAQVRANGGTERPISLDLLQALDDDTMTLGGEPCDTWLSGLGQRRNLLALGLPDVRFEAESIKLGYTKSLTFNGGEWIVDEVCPPKLAYRLKRGGNIHKYQSRGMGPIDDDVAPARQRIPGFDLYEGYIGTFFNMGVDRPNNNGVLKDLIEPSA